MKTYKHKTSYMNFKIIKEDGQYVIYRQPNGTGGTWHGYGGTYATRAEAYDYIAPIIDVTSNANSYNSNYVVPARKG